MLDNFNWLVLPESLTREVRGRGLLAWAEENIGVHLREPSGSDAIKVGVYGWGGWAVREPARQGRGWD